MSDVRMGCGESTGKERVGPTALTEPHTIEVGKAWFALGHAYAQTPAHAWAMRLRIHPAEWSGQGELVAEWMSPVSPDGLYT